MVETLSTIYEVLSLISSMGWREGRREREENIFSKGRITTTQDLGWRAHWGVAGQTAHWGVAGQRAHWGVAEQRAHWGVAGQRAHWGVAGQRTHWGVAGNLMTGWGLFIKRWRYGDKELRS